MRTTTMLPRPLGASDEEYRALQKKHEKREKERAEKRAENCGDDGPLYAPVRSPYDDPEEEAREGRKRAANASGRRAFVTARTGSFVVDV